MVLHKLRKLAEEPTIGAWEAEISPELILAMLDVIEAADLTCSKSVTYDTARKRWEEL